MLARLLPPCRSLARVFVVALLAFVVVSATRISPATAATITLSQAFDFSSAPVTLVRGGDPAPWLSLLLDDPTPSQSDFSGVYFGTFSGANDSGQLGILVRTNGSAVIIFYDAIDNVGGVNENVGINPDGSFAKINIAGRGTSVSGTFSASSASGNFVTSDGSTGSFIANKVSDTGFLQTAGGYYKGSLSGVVTANGIFAFNTSGSLFAIVAANGAGFAFAFASGGGSVAQDGGFISVSLGGTVSGTLLDGTSISGAVNTSNFTANGTFSVSTFSSNVLVVHSGTWSMSRQVPLPSRLS